MRKWMIGSVMVLSLAGCAGEADLSAPAVPPAAAATAVARPTRGVKPTAAQVAAYRAELSQLMAKRPTNDAAMFVAPGSMRRVSVEGMGSVALARYGADGQVAHACLDDVDDAMNFLTNVDASTGLEVQ